MSRAEATQINDVRFAMLTKQLLLSMAEGRRPIDVFNEVSKKVAERMRGEQIPWIGLNSYPDGWTFTSMKK